MVIEKKRIRNLALYLGFVPPGTLVRLGVEFTDELGARLERIGFGRAPATGDTLLPGAVGPVSRFNAHGKELVRRDLPKETVYYQREWTWLEWHGRDRVERSRIVDVPRERYPRDFAPPPSVELEVAEHPGGTRYIVTDAEPYTTTNTDSLLHKVNLVLEIFGRCQVLRDDLHPLMRAPVRRLNWRILPPGELPWEQVRTALTPAVQRARPGSRAPIWARFAALQQHRPNFYASGEAGFSGYVIFGYQRLGLYVLESVRYGNATYVLDHDWERLSRLTKAEILRHDHHRARLIHRAATWQAQLQQLFQAAHRGTLGPQTGVGGKGGHHAQREDPQARR